MKNSVKSYLIVVLFCFLQILSPVSAENNPLLDPIVGYWVSSSGTPLTISYSNQEDVAWLSINGGPSIDLKVQDRFGEIIFGYTAPDGDEMGGMYHKDSDTITVDNAPKRTFEATWRRRK